MSFKILLPVATPASLAETKLVDLEGLEKNLIMINNWTDPGVDRLSKEFAARGAEVYDCKYNLGLGASWNFGMKRMMEDGDSFTIILSASAVFDQSIRYFIDAIQEHETKDKMARYLCSHTATLHCFAHTRLGVELGGYFDENFWPIYFEDTDFCHRSKFNGIGGMPQDIKDRSSINTDGGLKVKNFGMNDVVHSYKFSVACNTDPMLMQLHQQNCSRWSEYYVRKWGGTHGSEKFTHPFNNQAIHVNTWRIEGNFNHHSFPKGWLPPAPSKRY